MRQRIGRGTVPAQLVAQVLRYHFYAFTKISFALQQLPEPAVCVIPCGSLGVREDIEQGVVYLKRAAWANYEPAKEALTHYKKSALPSQ